MRECYLTKMRFGKLFPGLLHEPSLKTLRKMAEYAKIHGYGGKFKNEDLVKTLAKKRDRLLGTRATTKGYDAKRTNYLVACLIEFEEFAFLDPFILEYVANLKSASKSRASRKASRELVKIIFDIVIPKYQGQKRGKIGKAENLLISGTIFSSRRNYRM